MQGNKIAGRHWQTEREERVSDRRQLEAAARTAWGDWFEQKIQPTVFGTLTFKPPVPADARAVGIVTRRGKEHRVSDPAAERAYARFLDLASSMLGCQVIGIAVNEHTKAGHPHGHCLLRLSRPHRKGDMRLLELAWKKSHRRAGMTRFERPKVKRQTGRYCGKYLAKDTSRGEGVVFSRDGW